MYYCNKCEEYITPKLADDMCTDVCPYCGKKDIERAGSCEVCGNPFRSYEDYYEECTDLADRYILELGIELHITTDKARDLLMAVMEEEE